MTSQADITAAAIDQQDRQHPSYAHNWSSPPCRLLLKIMLMIQALWYLHPHHLSSALAKSIILIMFILLPSIMWIFKAWLRWSSRHWPPSSSRLKMIAGFMEFLLLLVTRLSLFAAWSFARQWIMKPFRLLIKWSVQLDLTQIPINSLAGELQKRPRILIVIVKWMWI